jgi:hypothetical protein
MIGDMMNESAKLATLLANTYANVLAAPRPMDGKLARSKFDGIARTAHVFGYGRTPTEVELITIEWLREFPRPQDLSAFQKERKQWEAQAKSSLAERLDKLKD